VFTFEQIYNDLDVNPGAEATKKLYNFFKSLNLDMHKDEISIPELVLKYMRKCMSNIETTWG
jgi:hypothetical protein